MLYIRKCYVISYMRKCMCFQLLKDEKMVYLMISLCLHCTRVRFPAEASQFIVLPMLNAGAKWAECLVAPQCNDKEINMGVIQTKRQTHRNPPKDKRTVTFHIRLQSSRSMIAAHDLGIRGSCSMCLGHLLPFSVQGHLGSLGALCFKKACSSKRAGRIAKRSSCSIIWGTLVF